MEIINNVFFVIYNSFAPWQETFADAGDGDGGGDHLGQFWIHFKIILTPFWIHFRTI